MASALDSLSNIRHIYECSVCMEVLRDPKTLLCEHSFCKECLEGCVEFDNQMPFISCPTCRHITTLGDVETVSGLKSQLILRQILDGMKECNDRHDGFRKRCNSVEGKLSPRCCNLTIEWYCFNCKSYFCKKCFNLHSLLSSCGIEFYEVKYSELYDTFTPYCGRHNAFHRHGCLRCTSTFCTYCKIEHINKSEECKIVSFKEYGNKFKDPLLQKITLMKDFKVQQTHVLDDIDKTTSNVQSQSDIIKKHIEERKIIILSQVLFLLQLAGKQVQNNFDNELKEYEIGKEKVKGDIESKLNSVDEVFKKSEDLANSSFIEIISQVKDMQDDFHKVLPSNILEKEINFPELQVNMESETTVDSMDNLFNAIQVAFGDIQLCTLNNDGSYESTKKMLNTNSNNIDCSTSMFSKLSTVSESKKYISKGLKQLGLSNTDSKPDDNCPNEQVIGDDNKKEKKKSRSKKKKGEATTDLPEDIEGEPCLGDAVPDQLPSKRKFTAYLGGLPDDVTHRDIFNLFKGLKVVQIRLPRNKDTGDLQGHAYVDFFNAAQFQSALALNGKNIRDRHIRINIAHTKTSTSEEGKDPDNASSDESEDSSIKSGYSTENRQRRGGKRGSDASCDKFGELALDDGCYQEESGSESDDENESTTVGVDTSQRGKRGGRRRGRRNRGDRGGRGGAGGGRGAASGVRGAASGFRGAASGGRGGTSSGNRGGQNRGQHPNQRGRGTNVAHQRPASASSFPSLAVCYRCGALGHVVSNCPQVG